MKIRLLLCISVLAISSSCEGFDPNAYVPGLHTSTPAPSQSPTSAPETAIATLIPSTAIMEVITVCTNIPGGKLNVRFAPGEKSNVRGYLAEGEKVILSGEQKDVDKGIWGKLSSPIEGWVNQRYLCEAKP